MKRTLAACSLMVAMMTTGCASIIHGTHQDISINSNPNGATILIDDTAVGTTPFVAELKRKNRKTIRIEMDGYQPFEIELDRKVDGWYAGNLFFGGIIGLIVDASNGAMYRLTPSQVDAQLSTGAMSLRQGDGRDDTILVSVVLTPEPDWELFANLSVDQN